MTFFPWFFRLCQHYQFITDHLFVLQCLPKHISVNEERRCYLICVYIYIICINAYTFNVYIYFHWNIFKINSLITRWFFFLLFILLNIYQEGEVWRDRSVTNPFMQELERTSLSVLISNTAPWCGQLWSNPQIAYPEVNDVIVYSSCVIFTI